VCVPYPRFDPRYNHAFQAALAPVHHANLMRALKRVVKLAVSGLESQAANEVSPPAVNVRKLGHRPRQYGRARVRMPRTHASCCDQSLLRGYACFGKRLSQIGPLTDMYR